MFSGASSRCLYTVSVLLSLGSYLQSDGSFCTHFPQVRFASRDFEDMLETRPGTLNHHGTMVDFYGFWDDQSSPMPGYFDSHRSKSRLAVRIERRFCNLQKAGRVL